MHGCPTLNPPINGAVVQSISSPIAQMSCKSGFYPDREVAFLYMCANGLWVDPAGIAKVPLPGCLSK